jgi:hypothetical protein
LSRIQVVTTQAQTASSHQNQSKTPETSGTSVQLVDNEHRDLGSEEADGIGYQAFLKADEAKLRPTKNVVELTGNLFSVNTEIALAHCVSADFKAKKGIALEFQKKFGRVNELRRQKCQLTEIATVNVDNRQVFYIIIKNFFWQKASYETIFQSLQNLRKICAQHQVTQLACPRLGCSLDGLK